MSDRLEALRAALQARYTVERRIGEGGTATVYLARDPRHDRPVAIKVLRPELTASLGPERFLREIKVAAHLQHPNILALYDSGEAGGMLYYVMPYIEGESLRARLGRETQLPLDEAIRLTREIAEALQCAHAHGIVHRDIKPENILLQEGHALVADFGLARAISEAGGDELTQTGIVVGTPHYMSPEQALGSRHLDGRSDEYSLACVVYEMLTGVPPFDGPNPVAIVARHSMEGVPSLQVVRHSVPDEVESAVLRALEKTPADRFPTILEFAEALTDTATGPVRRRTSSHALRRAAAPGRRSPRRPWWPRLATLGAAAIGAWGLWQLPGRGIAAADLPAGTLDPRRVAVLYLEDESGDSSLRYLADGLTEELIRELGQIRSLDVVSSGGVAPYRGGQVSRDSIARALRAGTLVAGHVEREEGRVSVTVRLVDGASGADFERAGFDQPPGGDLLAVQDTLAGKVAGLIRSRLGEEIRLREQRDRASSAEAWALVQQGRLRAKAADAAAERGDSDGTAREFRSADSLFALAEAEDPRWVEPPLGRAAVAYRQSRLAGDDPVAAQGWIGTGLGHAGRALELSPRNPDALELRGNLRYWRWLLSLESDRSRAQALLRAARADLETAVKLAPDQAGAWATLAHLEYQSGDLVAVKIAATRAYEEDAYLSNADVVLSRLFYVTYDLGQFAEAKRWCTEVQARFPRDPESVSCRLYLLTMDSAEPDVPQAWRLTDSLARLAPEPERAFLALNARMLVAATLARAGLADSARRLAEASRGSPDIDPTHDLRYAEAFVRTLLGDRAEAFEALKVYFAANPEKLGSFADQPTWWFRGLRDDPRYRELAALAE